MDAKAERLEETSGQVNMWKITYAGLDDFEQADYRVQNHYKKFVQAHYHDREETEAETTQKKDQYIKGLSTAVADVFKHLLQHHVAKLGDAEAAAALQASGARPHDGTHCATGQAGWSEEVALARHVVGQ